MGCDCEHSHGGAVVHARVAGRLAAPHKSRRRARRCDGNGRGGGGGGDRRGIRRSGVRQMR